MTAMRIALQRLLEDQRKPVEPLAHVGAPRCQSHPNARRDWDHRCDSVDHARHRRRVNVRPNKDPFTGGEHNLHAADMRPRRRCDRNGGCPFVRDPQRQELQRFRAGRARRFSRPDVAR